jgi:hypothetical protein
MAGALATVVAASLLIVAVSGVSATAAPVTPPQVQQPDDARSQPSRPIDPRDAPPGPDDGDIHLGADFFAGSGGVGADPAYVPSYSNGAVIIRGRSMASARALAFAHARIHGGSHGGGRKR